MKKAQSCKVTKMVSTSCSSSVSTLSIPVEECGVTTVAPSTLNNIRKKATNLVMSEGHNILNAPWLSDEKARLVKSSSSPHPHIVKTHKNKKLYCCDDNFVMFKGFSLCAHVVAVAEHNGDLRSFLDSVSATCGSNLTAIANQGMPGGAGRKGGVPKRKRKCTAPVQSRSVRPCFEQNTKPSPNQECSSTSSSASSLRQSSSTSFCYLDNSSTLNEVTGPDMLASAPDLIHQFMSSIPVTTTCYSPSISLPTTGVSQATSHGQVVGTGVSFNIASPVLNSKLFTLKLKNKQIRVC